MRLSGQWFNELGSKMVLTVNRNEVHGKYHTAVGDTKGKYHLVGRTDTCGKPSQSVGFVVCWQNKYKNSNSVTTWCGQLQKIDGKEVITTTWLLNRETEPPDNWESTLVGKDIFTRNKPDPKSIQKLKKLKGMSHPGKA